VCRAAAGAAAANRVKSLTHLLFSASTNSKGLPHCLPDKAEERVRENLYGITNATKQPTAQLLHAIKNSRDQQIVNKHCTYTHTHAEPYFAVLSELVVLAHMINVKHPLQHAAADIELQPDT
jgi:hypothetical protein